MLWTNDWIGCLESRARYNHNSVAHERFEDAIVAISMRRSVRNLRKLMAAMCAIAVKADERGFYRLSDLIVPADGT